MTTIYSKHLLETPQSEPIPGRETDMVKNAAGGYSFEVDDFARLERFLILGTEGGTYYVGEGKLTRENAAVVIRCVKEDGVRVVNRIVEISDQALAPKNDEAIFALAIAAKTGDATTRSLAYKVMPQVCRTGTHLFQFCEAIDGLGGWGRGARNAVARWYTEKDPEKLAYQLVKYRQRDGWTHRDALRLAHPAHAPLLAYAAGKFDGDILSLPPIVGAYETAKVAKVGDTVGLIRRWNLPRECVNTEFLNDPEILEALLVNMPATALLRNLGNLTSKGILTPFSTGTKRALELLNDDAALKRARVHPMAIYLSLAQYVQGHGDRGALTWAPVQNIVDALEGAFYATMGNVTPSGKNLLFCLDTSGSMQGSFRSGSIGLDSPIAKAAAMALIAAKTETSYEIIGVDVGIQHVGISPSMRLSDAIREAARHGGGGTDLSLPYKYLVNKGYSSVEGVIVYTDSETWAGTQGHPAQALEQFRRTAGHPVRNAIVSMVATGHSVGDTKDPLTLQCVGLDASLPSTLSAFMRGEF